MRRYIDLLETIISEISRLDDLGVFEDDREAEKMLEKYRRHKPRKLGPLVGDLDLYVAQPKFNYTYIFAVDNWYNPVGYVELEHSRSKTYRVRMVYVDHAHRGQGVALALYLGALKRGFILLSDIDQTPGGQGIWAALARNSNVEVSRVLKNRRENEPIDDPTAFYNDDETAWFSARWKTGQ